jgi:hypothetical protein
MGILLAGTKITLSLEAQNRILRMDDRIGKQDRSYFEKNFKVDKSMPMDKMNINGFGAESAFNILVGVEFDSTTNKYENHYKKKDCKLRDGATIDTKQTVYPNGWLLVRCGKERMYVEIYTLMIGVFPTYMFGGFAFYEEIIRPENIVDKGHGPSYGLPQHKLIKTLYF